MFTTGDTSGNATCTLNQCQILRTVEFVWPGLFQDRNSAQKRCAPAARRAGRHHALASLTFAHIDCDAFYANRREARINPELADTKPSSSAGWQAAAGLGRLLHLAHSAVARRCVSRRGALPRPS